MTFLHNWAGYLPEMLSGLKLSLLIAAVSIVVGYPIGLGLSLMTASKNLVAKAIANTIATFIRPGPPGIEGIELRVINIAADGPVVMTERVDLFTLPGRSFELPVMGTFEVSDGKINAWRDYFDMNQFTSRMG